MIIEATKPAIWVTKFEVVRPHVLDLVFNDGKRRRVDLAPQIRKGRIYEPLQDPAYFAKAFIEGDTVAWPNGADFAPEFLYEDAKEVVEA